MSRKCKDKDKEAISKKITDDILDPSNKLTLKEIASKYKVDISLVMHIAKTKGRKALNKQNIEVDSNESEDTVITPVGSVSEKMRKKYTRITEDIVISILVDIDDGMSKKDVCEKYDISRSSLSRLLKKYEDITNDNDTETTNEIEKEEVDETKEEKEEHVITDSIKLSVIKDLNMGKSPVYISSKYNISMDDISSISKEFGIQVKIPVNNIIEIKPNNIPIEAGLIYDRHDMPVDKYIFTDVNDNGISEHLMFNYEEQDKICEEFILSNIGFKKTDNGYIAKTDLVVYITGLSCCIASIIKVAQQMHVNLTLKHYDFKTGRYIPQYIWTEFDSLCNSSPFDLLFKEPKNKVFLNNLTIDQLSNGTYWCAKKVEYLSGKINEAEYYFSSSYEECMMLYTKLSKDIMTDTSKKYGVFVIEGKMNRGNFYFIKKSYSKIYNYK